MTEPNEERPVERLSRFERDVLAQLDGTGPVSEFVLPRESAMALIRQNVDIVARGMQLGSDADYVAKQIVQRTEAKGVKVPRQEPVDVEDEPADE